MQFDARAASQLKPGEHLTIAEWPGLQLRANGNRKTWTYRYRSPVDGNMRPRRSYFLTQVCSPEADPASAQ